MINIASKLHTSVLISGDPEIAPVLEFTIAGERDPGAVAGCGITYDVDDAAWDYWSTNNPDQAAMMKPVTQEEIDAAADQSAWYGFELGLEAEEEAPLTAFGILPETETARQAAASDRVQRAVVEQRRADEVLRQSEEIAKNAASEREEAQSSLQKMRDEEAAKPRPEPPRQQARPDDERRPDEPQPTQLPA